MSDLLDPSNSPKFKNMGTKKVANVRPLLFIFAIIIVIIFSFSYFVAAPTASEAAATVQDAVKTILSAQAPELQIEPSESIKGSDAIELGLTNQTSQSNQLEHLEANTRENKIKPVTPVNYNGGSINYERKSSEKELANEYRNKLFQAAFLSLAQDQGAPPAVAIPTTERRVKKGVKERSGNIFLMAGGVISCVLETLVSPVFLRLVKS